MNKDELEAWITARFQQEYQALAEMKTAFDHHQALLAKNSQENSELLEIFRSAKSLIRFGNGLASFFVWVSKAAIFCGILWGLWKFAVLETVRNIANGGKS